MSRRLTCSAFLSSLLFSANVALFFAQSEITIQAADESHPTSRIGTVLARLPEDAAVIDSLCRMGLYETAIARCRSGMASNTIGSMGHARWVGLLIESITEQDSERANTIQEALTEAKKIYDAYASDPKNQTKQVWVDYSFETARLKLIGRSVANYLAAPTNKARRDDALEAIRSLLDHAVEIKEQAHDQLGIALRRNDRDSSIQARDLGSLHNRLSLLEIDCLLIRCDCYPPDSDERIAAGTEALAAIDKITSRIESDWSGQELLDLARSQSLIALSRYADAAQSLTKWLTTVDDPSLRNRGIAWLAKTFQMQGDFAAAAKSLLSAHGDALNDSPEIAIATLELQIASWKKRAEQTTTSRPSAEESQAEIERILTTKEHVAERFGNYWRQRAEALIVASSLGSPVSPDSKLQPTSLDLLKVNIRQRLAAGDSPGAIELLDQAEAASLAASDLKQAFGFAKSAIGVMQQQFAGSEPISLANSQAIIHRIASTSRKYSIDEASTPLHLSAIDRQKNLLATEKALPNAALIAETYQQMLLDHVTTWPDHSSSDEIRSHLQRLYLSTDAVPALAELWSNEIAWLMAASNDVDAKPILQLDTRMAAATVGYINAKLLLSLVAESRNEVQPEVLGVLDTLPVDSQWMLEGLTADYDWWTSDGGLRQADSTPISWSLPANAFEKNASAMSIHQILSSLRKSELVDIRSDTQRIIEWIQMDNHGRIGWVVALYSKLSNVLRIRTLAKEYDRPSKEWLHSLNELQTAIQESMTTIEATLHPEIYRRLQEHVAIASARIATLQGDIETGIAKIEPFRREDSRSRRWTLELARLYELQDSENENGLKLYRQLATGSPVAYDEWYEARLSSIRCLRMESKSVEADQLLSLVQAMVADAPDKWKRRLK